MKEGAFYNMVLVVLNNGQLDDYVLLEYYVRQKINVLRPAQAGLPVHSTQSCFHKGNGKRKMTQKNCLYFLCLIPNF